MKMATGMGVNEMMLKAAASLEYSDLKPEQKCILKAFVEGKDIFVHFQLDSENPFATLCCH